MVLVVDKVLAVLRMAFSIINEQVKTNIMFKLTQRTVEFKLNSLPTEVNDPEAWIKTGLREIYDHATENIKVDDRVGLTLSSDFLQNEIHNPVTDMQNVSFDRLWEMVHNLYQRNTEDSEGDTLKLIVTSFPDSKAAANTASHTAVGSSHSLDA